MTSFCCALITPAVSQAQTSAPATCPGYHASGKPHNDVTVLKTKGKQELDAQQLAVAQSCYEEAQKLFPHDRDIAYQLVRLHAWQKDQAGAKALLQPWPTTDYESYELHGDLAWYEHDVKAAANWYQKAMKAQHPPSAVLCAKTVQALRAGKQDALAQALLNAASQRYPTDQPLQHLQASMRAKAQPQPSLPPRVPSQEQTVGLTAPALRLWFSLFATTTLQSQDQSAHAIDSDLVAKDDKLLLLVGVSSNQHRYSDSVRPTDNSLRLGLGYDLAANQETTLLYAYTPHAVFTYSTQWKLRHEVLLAPAWLIGLEGGIVRYPDKSFNIINPYVVHTSGAWRQTVKAFVSKGESSKGAGLIDLTYLGQLLVPELYGASGRDDSSRPYLSHAASSPFLTVGFKLAWLAGPDLALGVGVERRTEAQFAQNAFSGGLTWTK